MALTVRTQLPTANVQKTLDEIIQTSAETGHLTPRNRRQLASALFERRLAMVFDGQQLVAWALVEPLTKTLNELGMAYVKPEYRRTNAFKLLTSELTRGNSSLLFATYNSNLIRYGAREFGFRETTLKEVLRRSRGKFLLKRLNPASIRSIRSKFETKRPVYAIWERS